jgi:hypothetical protein
MTFDVGKKPSGRPMAERIARPSYLIQKIGTVDAPDLAAARAKALEVFAGFGLNETNLAVIAIKTVAR